jgi:hypothetical protein
MAQNKPGQVKVEVEMEVGYAGPFLESGHFLLKV